jgi:hypothetical protein
VSARQWQGQASTSLEFESWRLGDAGLKVNMWVRVRANDIKGAGCREV